MAGKPKHKVGDRVGKWKLLEYRKGVWGKPEGAKKAKELVSSAWKCQCSCGVIRWVDSGNICSGQSRSCGHTYRNQWAKKNLKPLNSVFSLGDHC